MSFKKSDLDRIIDTLCKNKDKEYKMFIKKLIYSMSDGDKWGKLSELKDLTDHLKK